MPSPRRFNFFTFVLLLGFAAGGYWLWKFFPVYFTAWQVDHALADGAAHCYPIARLGEPTRSTAKADIEANLRAEVVKLGITDPDLTVQIDLTDRSATASCDYTVVVQHIIASKTSVVHIHRSNTTDMKRVEW